MTVTVQILHGDLVMARIIYSPGFFVDISVEKSFRTKEPPYGPLRLKDSTQTYSWLKRLIDISTKLYSRHVMISCRMSHPEREAQGNIRTLFLTAARILENNLAPLGFRFRVSFG